MYTEEIALIAQRQNNTKRNYLVVNKYQGKHIPVNPAKALEMFAALAGLVKQRYQGERLLLVGFAETATAIGEALAVQLGTDYMQTTREQIEGVEYLYFSESHSHATEQKVVKNDLDAAILGAETAKAPLPSRGCPGILPPAAAQAEAAKAPAPSKGNLGALSPAAVQAEGDAKPHFNVSHIVFVEDEVTTGNTIWKIIQLIRQEYGENLRFSVASLLNGMDREAQGNYRKEGIDLVYLVKTDHSGYPALARQCINDGMYHKCQPIQKSKGHPSQNSGNQPFYERKVQASSKRGNQPSYEGKVQGFPERGNQPSYEGKVQPSHESGMEIEAFSVSGYINARRLHKGAEYQAACSLLWQGIKEKVPFGTGQEILVLGTEEFMYAPLYVAQEIQELGNRVKFHATTRSPIVVSKNPCYPLHERYGLVSLYDAGRITYLYDLAKYDFVLVITDAEPGNGQNGDFSEEGRQGQDFLEEPGLASLCNAISSCGNQKLYFVWWCGE